MSQVVPFFVLNLEGGKSKVFFTVPSHLAESIIQHPILCRGAAFELQIDQQQQQQQQKKEEDDNDKTSSSNSSSSRRLKNTNTTTKFLSTEFTSPHPDVTAEAIAERLASRIENACENPLSSILGF